MFSVFVKKVHIRISLYIYIYTIWQGGQPEQLLFEPDVNADTNVTTLVCMFAYKSLYIYINICIYE